MSGVRGDARKRQQGEHWTHHDAGVRSIIAAEVAKERERIEADVLELVREWTPSHGRLVLRDRDLGDFRDQLADVVAGRVL